MSRMKRIFVPIKFYIEMLLFVTFISIIPFLFRSEYPLEFMLLITPVSFLTYYLVYSYRNKVSIAEDEISLSVLKWGLAGFGLALLSNIVTSKLIISEGFSSNTTETIQKIHPYTMFLIVSVVAPIAEELVFRFALYNELVKKNSYSIYTFLIISGIIFGMLHIEVGSNLMSNLGIVAITGLSGIGFSYVYIKSDTIWAPILAHILYNTFILSLL